MTFLLDVNVLIALIDPVHVQHDKAHEWFAAEGRQTWATCPITENGVLRILGNSRYPNSPGVPAVVAPVIQKLKDLPGHIFWPDDISLIDSNRIDTERLMTTGLVTDSYLLALAVAHSGRLATFDRRLISDAVRDGSRALHLIN